MGNINWSKGGAYMKDLKKHKESLTKQQYRTLKGQIIFGDKKAAMKGLNKILKRNI